MLEKTTKYYAFALANNTDVGKLGSSQKDQYSCQTVV